ncbi:MAG: hypothetical protein AVDCRST_MAG51-2882 [uncultured Ramlibacter sp.]|uniref:Transmembrane protein n=1 Tax=uncultured Ramlibacter sp. TaxID=260755 RepID=A0A6J4QAQ8_9BURK|nr:MAG: hypothetical protein AVDCRST_MAG51-2882 [uncultured Ramlibacter sp.]
MQQAEQPLVSAAEVVEFWRQAGRPRWFRKDENFDRRFREKCLATHEAAVRGELSSWAADAIGALALVLLLDQFPRNAFRGTPRAFATDAMARSVADDALRRGLDQQIPEDLRHFFYLPFSHSENLTDQQRAVELTGALGSDADYHARQHREIIERFGRFPHRNPVLGRSSTPEELAYLAEGGFAG